MVVIKMYPQKTESELLAHIVLDMIISHAGVNQEAKSVEFDVPWTSLAKYSKKFLNTKKNLTIRIYSEFVGDKK